MEQHTHKKKSKKKKEVLQLYFPSVIAHILTSYTLFPPHYFTSLTTPTSTRLSSFVLRHRCHSGDCACLVGIARQPTQVLGDRHSCGEGETAQVPCECHESLKPQRGLRGLPLGDMTQSDYGPFITLYLYDVYFFDLSLEPTRFPL